MPGHLTLDRWIEIQGMAQLPVAELLWVEGVRARKGKVIGGLAVRVQEQVDGVERRVQGGGAHDAMH